MYVLSFSCTLLYWSWQSVWYVSRHECARTKHATDLGSIKDQQTNTSNWLEVWGVGRLCYLPQHLDDNWAMLNKVFCSCRAVFSKFLGLRRSRHVECVGDQMIPRWKAKLGTIYKVHSLFLNIFGRQYQRFSEMIFWQEDVRTRSLLTSTKCQLSQWMCAQSRDRSPQH